jgi:cytochrome oxidase assembly protein ShyY1
VWHVARRPKWIRALIAALFVAGVFAALGQWQLQRAIDEATVVERDTENAVPLASVATPQALTTTDSSGRMVEVACGFVAGDDVVVGPRPTREGSGYWLLRHCQTAEGASLAVAVGWAPQADALQRITPPPAQPEVVLVGRYVPSESPQQSDFRSGEVSAIAVAELINLWENPGPVYGGYLVLASAPEGLLTIGTEAPPTDRQLNWLNLFYAAEWVIFAGFAIYLWYRLVKDEWLRELEEAHSVAP